MTRDAPALFTLLFCSTITLVIYTLGLPGDFFFDDQPNLELLGNHGGVHDLSSLRLYLSESFAGPSGRPIAMLSFLLNAQDWPAEPGSFKLTNILLHVGNGLLLCWTLLLALPQGKLKLSRGQLQWVACIAAIWWMLTPYHVSTVLYVVQRMAELSTSFVLLGMIGYLYLRPGLARPSTRVYLRLSFVVSTATLGAVLSKENGALLPMLLLALEFTLLSRDKAHRPSRWWLATFLGLPSAAVLAFILSQLATPSAALLEYRGFTQLQRLLTESRLLMEYLWYLLIPHPDSPGLFRDNIPLSTSLLQPLTTLFSVLGIAVLTTASLLLRKSLPLLSAAIAFFLVGHLLESTLLPLELAFEHRNYMPSLLLFLPLAQALVTGYQRFAGGAVLAAVLIFLLLAATLAAHTQLWADRSDLYRVWARNNPTSPRAQLSYALTLEEKGLPRQALAFLSRSSARIPDNLNLKLHLLRLRAQLPGNIDTASVSTLIAQTKSAPFSHEAILASIALTDDLLSARSTGLSADQLLKLWQAFDANPNSALNSIMGAQIHHQQGRLFLHQGQINLALAQFGLALSGSQPIETGLKQSAILATQGHYCIALQHLQDTYSMLKHAKQAKQAKERSDYFSAEITRLRKNISADGKLSEHDCAESDSTSAQSAP